MERRLAVVTGARGGLGSALCKLLAADGNDLVLVDRDGPRSNAFAQDVRRSFPSARVDAFAVDLADHADIARLASEILAAHPKIDLLFNNAGVLTETLQFSAHGNELHFEVNALAPLQLIDRLRPALENARGATVLDTSAGLSLRVNTLDWDELVEPRSFSKLFGPYARSKQASNVLAAALGRELAGAGIAVRSADPGPTRTVLTKGAGTPLWMRLFYGLLPRPERNARKLLDAATLPKWAGRTGVLISGGRVRRLPDALSDERFQTEFLRRCRERVAAGSPAQA